MLESREMIDLRKTFKIRKNAESRKAFEKSTKIRNFPNNSEDLATLNPGEASPPMNL